MEQGGEAKRTGTGTRTSRCPPTEAFAGRQLGAGRRGETDSDSNLPLSADLPSALPLGQGFCRETTWRREARRGEADSDSNQPLTCLAPYRWTKPARETSRGSHTSTHTPSIAFRHLPRNSARFSCATEGVLFISAQLSTDAVSALDDDEVMLNVLRCRLAY